ncbi:MAG: GNAT family N-acetyltransferase, partial [Pseudomonadota bacterium]
DLAVATGLFQADDLGAFEDMLTHYFEGQLDDHCWIVDANDRLCAAAYYAPEMMTDGVWNLYFIGVRPEHQGEGRGAALLSYVEQDLNARSQRLLLVETSGLDRFDLTRKFYRKNGFSEEARIRDFYRTGEDKVVFRKVLTHRT